jgi:hypothetical protein
MQAQLNEYIAFESDYYLSFYVYKNNRPTNIHAIACICDGFYQCSGFVAINLYNIALGL